MADKKISEDYSANPFTWDGTEVLPGIKAGVNGAGLVSGLYTYIRAGLGDVVGPGSATSAHVAVFSGTTGKLLADSGLTLSGPNTGDQTITLTGDVTGTGTGTFAATLAASGVTPGSYTYPALTVDAKGRVTAAANGTPPTGGTVSSVSVVTANGVSASVATSTTTPALTFTLGDITPTSVAATGTVTGSNLSGTNTGNETTTTEGALVNGATAKATPVDADQLGLMDSAASNILKKLSWSALKATLKTYFDTLYGAGSGSVTSVSVTTANGVSGSVATATSTPAITLALGDITPSSIVDSGASGALPALPTGTASARLRVAEADGVANVVLFDSFGSGNALYGRRANGTIAAKTAIASGQGLLTIGGFGYGATAYSVAAVGLMSLNATEAWTDSAQGCEWRFSTTATGGIVRTLVLTIGQNGSLTVTGAVTGSNLSGTNTGNETTTTEGALISGATAKTTPVDADYVGLMDSAASSILKKLSWANIKATLKTYLDTLYAPLSQPFDAAAFFPGVPTASAKVARIPIARAVSFAANFAGSYFSASANATATTVFDVQKNGSSIGSVSIASGGTVATFTTTSGAIKTFAAGDVLAIIAPATPDTTLADVGFVLAGTR